MNEPIGMAAFWTVNHLLRAMVSRGLVSPNELNEIHGSMIEGIQGMGDPALAARIEGHLEKPFLEMRATQLERWIGKRQTDTRQAPVALQSDLTVLRLGARLCDASESFCLCGLYGVASIRLSAASRRASVSASE